MSASILDGKATAARGQGGPEGAGGRARRPRGSCRGSARSWSATTRGRAPTWRASTGTARRWASPRSAGTCPPRAAQAQVEEAVARAERGPGLHRVHRAAAAAARARRAGACCNLMDPAKDADGLHPVNLGKLVLGEKAPLPCTPHGIVVLLRQYGVEIAGAEVTVIGRGITVGRALGLLLTRQVRERDRDARATPAPRTSPRTPAPPTSWWSRPGGPGC